MTYAASLAGLLAACLLAACGAPDDATPSRLDRVGQAPAVAPSAPASGAAIVGDWRARVDAEVAALRRDDAALYGELMALAPQRTRAGLPRFTSTPSADPRATAVFLDRLRRGAPDAERIALAEVLARTTGTYADAVVDLLEAERSASVRAVLVHTARRVPADLALPVLRRGLADPAPEVVAEAARTAAGHAVGARLDVELRAALAAVDAQVRAEAARALGILGVVAARAELEGTLVDLDADVRLAALRALDRVAPGSVPATVLASLARDADPRVSRLATRLADTASR